MTSRKFVLSKCPNAMLSKINNTYVVFNNNNTLSIGNTANKAWDNAKESITLSEWKGYRELISKL